MRAANHDATEQVVGNLIADPASFADQDLAAAFSLSPEQRERIALAGLRRRFGEMRPRVAALDDMAREQGVAGIERVEDGAYLLLPHTAYKSYPLSMLERAQFGRLTRWFQGLVAVELSGFDGTRFKLIDDWIAALEKELGVQVVHTSGTTGKLSLLPRNLAQAKRRMEMTARYVRDWHGKDTGPDIMGVPTPVIYPSYATGSTAPGRQNDVLRKYVAKSPENFLALFDEHLSADLASLAGRLAAAEARGEQGRLEITPELLARRDEMIAREAGREERVRRFFDTARERFGGRDIYIMGVLPVLYDWAAAGLADGHERMFGPGTVVQSGGGSKGRELPADAVEQVKRFVGTQNYIEGYGMSEMAGIQVKCDHGHFHIAPYIVPYLLDAETGAPLPREGTQTGRFGFVDLFPDTAWSGFLTGDKVTLSGWHEPCECGRTGPYAHSPIHRFSELQGGDDKVTCAGAPAAHDKALAFLASLA